MRLWARLMVLSMAIAIMPLALLGILGIDRAARDAEKHSEELLESDAAVRARSLGRWVGDQAVFLDGLTRPWPGLASMEPKLQTGFLLAVYQAMPHVVVVALVDASGSLVVPPMLDPAAERPAVDPAFAASIASRLPFPSVRGGGVALGDAVTGVTGPAPLVPLVVRGNRDPEVPIYLGADLYLHQVEELLGSTSDLRAYALMDGAGRVFVGADHPLVEPGLLKAVAGTDTSMILSHELPSGEGVRVGASPVPNTTWTLIVVSPEAEVEQPANEVRAYTLTVLLVTAALAAFLAWWMASSLADPVEKLRDSALEVAAGRYDKRAEVARSDEIGELANAFNHMSGRLDENRREIRAQQDEIEAFNRELQDRVERRTQELRDAQGQLVRSGQLAAVAEIGAGLAHELNNPLAAILGTVQLLRARGRADGGTADPALSAVEEQAERCREVVATMLRFSSGEVDLEKAPVVDLRDVLREAVGLVRGPYRQRGVSLELEEAPATIPVRVDTVHGVRILAQILNALRAGLSEGSVLRVSARERLGEAEVIMAPDQAVAVHSLRDDWMASGMGLWVARRVLHELGGRLIQPIEITVEGTRLPTEEQRPTTSPGFELPPLTEELTTEERSSGATSAPPRWRVVFPGA